MSSSSPFPEILFSDHSLVYFRREHPIRTKDLLLDLVGDVMFGTPSVTVLDTEVSLRCCTGGGYTRPLTHYGNRCEIF